MWRVDRAAHHQFESWIFNQPKLPPLSTVRERIVDLVGMEELDRGLADDWIDKQIESNVAILKDNYRRVKKVNLPQAIVGKKIVVGTMRDSAKIDHLLADQFGLEADKTTN